MLWNFSPLPGSVLREVKRCGTTCTLRIGWFMTGSLRIASVTAYSSCWLTKSKCGQFFQCLQYAPRNWIRMCAVESLMCLSSLVACEKHSIREPCEWEVPQSMQHTGRMEYKWLYSAQGQNGHWPQKAWIFLGGITATQRRCSRKIIKCLSSCE